MQRGLPAGLEREFFFGPVRLLMTPPANKALALRAPQRHVTSIVRAEAPLLEILVGGVALDAHLDIEHSVGRGEVPCTRHVPCHTCICMSRLRSKCT